ncbi:MAG: penicillin-binding protein 1C [Treponema sp.]|nr:penicillin-binding protein 1C [Treponema sp.]
MKKPGVRLKLRTKLTLGIILLCLLLLVLTVFIYPASLLKKSQNYSYALYDKNGILLGAQVAKDEQWRFEPSKVPEKFRRCIILYEDKRYYFHCGVDLISIARALQQNIKQDRIVSGGSTITMQTMRILMGNQKRTYAQKCREALAAIIFEIRFSKKKLLELYCANAPFGGNVIGLEAASWRYFNRPPAELTWAEAATLAVLPNQPALVYPGANSSILLEKRNALLQKLLDKKIIDQNTYELSLVESLPSKPYALPTDAYHYLEYSKKKSSGSKTKFYTTIDNSIQKNTTRIIEYWSQEFGKKGIDNAAALILDTQTLDVLAYCGNTGMSGRNLDSYAVDIIQSKRSSGSLLKPFLYAAMLDSGELLQDQLVIDIPTRIGSYKPDNNISIYSGAVPASEALTRSLNIPAIRELQQFGINRFLDILRKSGFTTFNRTSDDYGLPLILGGGEITMWEAARAYANLMNTALGNEKASPFSVADAWITLEVLSTGIRPDDEANWQKYLNSKQIAWKTGTSNGNRDAWAIGVTPEYTVAVWVGNASGRGTPDLKSISTTAPVLFNIFSTLPATTWPAQPVEEFTAQTVCVHSGYAAGQNCAETKTILRAKKAITPQVCPYCTTVSFTPDGKYRATAEDLIGQKAGEYNGTSPKIEKCFVLPPNLEYWYKNNNISYRTLPEFVPWHTASTKDNLSIVFPAPDANLIIPVELDGSPGAMVMQVASRSNEASIYWDVDGQFIGVTEGKHEITINPEPGKHILTITDSNGNILRRSFTILEK